MRFSAAFFALLVTASAAAAETGSLVRFITCPIYRDTDAGRKSGCWLADDPATGIRYDVTQSPHKPDWNHVILVEGRVSDEKSDLCGATVLNAVRTSIIEAPCARHMIPAEGHPGRRFTLPARNLQPLSNPQKPPPGPYKDRAFSIFFEFDRDFITYQYSDYLLDQAALWLRAAKPRKLIITGFAATKPETVSGLTIGERPDVAAERAAKVAESLHRLMPDLLIEQHTSLGAQPVNHPDADGLPGQSQRRAEIMAIFGE